jgi:hypothetical protein
LCFDLQETQSAKRIEHRLPFDFMTGPFCYSFKPFGDRALGSLY